ncbi:hypothetical protein K458DRAFT_396086 [Lentithecium fluviatile CBS 122367]|uniref:Extracellular membrane protein CFEM domain-containing protein n=1 Tax=Lentithecium fluviatile CBS 122367 TaxID=1168545 RepID=A0A6G1IGX7_9PLEO|nr:hypothetical protein K458DRAFT_396086 [Lentithecium fluviatile CBS 122367]
MQVNSAPLPSLQLSSKPLLLLFFVLLNLLLLFPTPTTARPNPDPKAITSHPTFPTLPPCAHTCLPSTTTCTTAPSQTLPTYSCTADTQNAAQAHLTTCITAACANQVSDVDAVLQSVLRVYQDFCDGDGMGSSEIEGLEINEGTELKREGQEAKTPPEGKMISVGAGIGFGFAVSIMAGGFLLFMKESCCGG